MQSSEWGYLFLFFYEKFEGRFIELDKIFPNIMIEKYNRGVYAELFELSEKKKLNLIHR